MDPIAPINVLFLSQQRLLRHSFSEAFLKFPDIHFLPTVADVNEAVASMLESEPDVILLDLNPSLFGITVAKQLQAACPGCKILVLASHSDSIAAAQLIAAGVKGVLTKDIGFQDLASAIRQASAGKTVCAIAGDPFSLEEVSARPVSGITERETQVLEFVAQGLANKQIAAALGISIKTVEKHRHRVMCKLQAHETAGLTWRAICMGVARGAPSLAFIAA